MSRLYSPYMKLTSKQKKWLVVVFAVILIAVIAEIALLRSISKESDASLRDSIPTLTNATVVVKDSSVDSAKRDVYLKDLETGEEKLFITLDDLNSSHYHPAEYHHGNVYLIRRTGGEYGYQNDPNWTDQLWIYTDKKQATKLYETQGLDFRVSTDEQSIAINTTDRPLTILNETGGIVKKFTAQELGIDQPDHQASLNVFGLSEWDGKTLWLADQFGPGINGLIKVELSSFSVHNFDLSKESMGAEYELNSTKELLVFSDMPVMLDDVSASQFAKSKKPVTLYLLNLKTQTKTKIATSVAKAFEPHWANESTIEYFNPNGTDRLTKTID